MRNEEGEILTCAVVSLFKTSLGDGFVDTLSFSAVETPMQHRRKGYVRELFDFMLNFGIEQGAVMSILHPFSFSYYEKFGYGKVADHKILRMPIRLLDTVPRCCELEKWQETPEEFEELYALHNEFCKNRQFMMLYSDPKYLKGKEIWIYRENGKATGYISVTTSKRLEINHYEDGLLSVQNIVYITPTALKALLGFIRMFEGELDDVEFANLSTCPEVETYLRHDTHTRIRLLPDLMARALDTEKLLASFKYPKWEGSFTLCVEDKLPTVSGVFSVKYRNGDCEVKRLENSADFDIKVNSSTLSRLVFGYDRLTAEQARFCDGITINGNAEDFFSAFSNRIAGMFEHF
jgi:predicted acetyltransferase